MRTLTAILLVLSFFGAAHEVHEEVSHEEITIKVRRPHGPHREGEHTSAPNQKGQS